MRPDLGLFAVADGRGPKARPRSASLRLARGPSPFSLNIPKSNTKDTMNLSRPRMTSLPLVALLNGCARYESDRRIDAGPPATVPNDRRADTAAPSNRGLPPDLPPSPPPPRH